MSFLKPDIPAMPKMPDPVRITSPTDQTVVDASRRKAQEDFAARQGRQSTILTNDNPNYSRTTLG